MRRQHYWCVLRQSKYPDTQSITAFRAEDDAQALSVCHKTLARKRMVSAQALLWDGFILKTIDPAGRNIVTVTAFQWSDTLPAGPSTVDGS